MRTIAWMMMAGLTVACGADSTSETGSPDSGLVDAVDVAEGSDGTDESDATDGTDGTDQADATEPTDGTDATDGTDSTDGTEGTDTTDGTEGTDTTDGTDETDGTGGHTDGTDGLEGTDGIDGGDECGGDLGCDPGKYCEYPVGTCGDSGESGQCVEMPGICGDIYDPVCGCDGKTYSNPCKAAQAGVNVGPGFLCGSGDGSCGKFLGGSCDTGEYCVYAPEDACGVADAPGTCEPIPTDCGEELPSVCGCDGTIYDNVCEAAAQGVSPTPDSSWCGPPPEEPYCGGDLGWDCPGAEYCNYTEGDPCGAEGTPGVCTVKPSVCSGEVEPVCGCDGQWYDNACNANLGGTSPGPVSNCPEQE